MSVSERVDHYFNGHANLYQNTSMKHPIPRVCKTNHHLVKLTNKNPWWSIAILHFIIDIYRNIYFTTKILVIFLRRSVLLDLCVPETSMLNITLTLSACTYYGYVSVLGQISWKCKSLSFLKTICKNCFCTLDTFYHVKCFDKSSFVVFVVHVVIV